MAESLSEITSVGWKWPASRQSIVPRREGVSEIELVRADHVRLGAQAEELALHASRGLNRVSIDPAWIASSDIASRSRGPFRSTGASFDPSGIQMFVTQGDPSAPPIAAPIRRQAIP